MKESIFVESRVVVSLQRFGTRNMLCNIEKICGVGEFSISIIVRKFWCEFICNIYLFNFQMKVKLGL